MLSPCGIAPWSCRHTVSFQLCPVGGEKRCGSRNWVSNHPGFRTVMGFPSIGIRWQNVCEYRTWICYLCPCWALIHTAFAWVWEGGTTMPAWPTSIVFDPGDDHGWSAWRSLCKRWEDYPATPGTSLWMRYSPNESTACSAQPAVDSGTAVSPANQNKNTDQDCPSACNCSCAPTQERGDTEYPIKKGVEREFHPFLRLSRDYFAAGAAGMKPANGLAMLPKAAGFMKPPQVP